MGEDKFSTGVHGVFSAVAIAFMKKAVVAMIPWILVMFAVIFCDLAFALRRCKLMGEPIRISRALRATMGKCVTYFSFVMVVCMLEVATNGTLKIDKWTCLAICLIEFCSIVSNILRPKGYSVDFVKMVTALAKKLFKVDVDDIAQAIHKEDDGQER